MLFGGLEELDVDCACAEADLHVFYFHCCGAGGCAAKEGELKGDWGCWGVVLFWMRVREMCYGEIVEDGCCVAAVGD
jgi:hypothetical protein